MVTISTSAGRSMNWASIVPISGTGHSTRPATSSISPSSFLRTTPASAQSFAARSAMIFLRSAGSRMTCAARSFAA